MEPSNPFSMLYVFCLGNLFPPRNREDVSLQYLLNTILFGLVHVRIIQENRILYIRQISDPI